MNKFYQKITQNGILSEYHDELKENIRLTNVLNIAFILFVFPFFYIFRKSSEAMLITSIPIFLHILSLILIGVKLNKIGRFLFSITTSTSVYIIASFIYIDNGTDGMAAKFLMLGTIILPFAVFEFKEKKFIAIAIILDFMYMISFNYMNSILTLKDLVKNLDSPFLRIFSVFTAFTMFLVTFFQYKYNHIKNQEKLKKSNIELKSKNEELLTVEEELRQNNEELQTLKEEIQKQLEKTNEEKRLQRTITDAVSSAIILINNNEEIKFWNKGAEKIFNYASREILDKNIHQVLTPDEYRTKAFEMFNHFKHNGKGNGLNKTIEIEALRKNGEKFPIELYITPLKIKDKWNAVGIVSDITERKKYEKKLKDSEIKFKTIFNSSYAGISILTYDGIHIDTNPNCEKIHGYTREELIGKKFRDFSHPDDIVHSATAVKLLLTGQKEKVELEVRLFHKNTNEIIWIYAVMTKYTQISDKSNNDILVVFQDITKQKIAEEKLAYKNELIKSAHKNILDSINYATTIQQAILTDERTIANYIKDFFIFFKPKEKVSGDFYYFNKINNITVIAIADCTGHGVPGGFLTMLGITYLHDIIRREEAHTPAKVLNILRDRIKEIFKSFDEQNKNGLDMALCFIDEQKNKLQYAGAYNPLIIIRDNNLIEYKATRNPIGFYPVEIPFKNEMIELQNNDVIYLYSDGFQDQLGYNYKKFMSKNFKKLLLKIYNLPTIEQKNILRKTFEDWKKGKEQTDDVTIFGMKTV